MAGWQSPLPSAVKSPAQIVTRRSFNQFDPAEFERRLRTTLLFTSPASDVSDFADQMQREVVAVLDDMCPAETRRRRLPRHRRPPLSTEAHVSKRRRRQLERRWLKTRNADDRAAFRHCCRQTNMLINESRRRHFSNQIDQCHNARQRWTVIRRLLHTSNTSPVAQSSSDLCNCNTFQCQN